MHSGKHSNILIRVLLAAGLSILLSACGGSDSGVASPANLSSASTANTSTPGSSSSSNTSSSSSNSSTNTTTSVSTTGIIKLQWTAPVSRTDGTPLSLSEIAGYRVHYGTSPGNYPNHVNINNGSLQSASVTGVPVGTYYVAMSTYDSSGLESQYSAPVVKQAL
jgi:hypothetical protein